MSDFNQAQRAAISEYQLHCDALHAHGDALGQALSDAVGIPDDVARDVILKAGNWWLKLQEMPDARAASAKAFRGDSQ